MWSVIIIFIIALVGFVIYSISKGDYEAGYHFENFMFFLTNIFGAAAITFGATLLIFFGSAIYVGEADAPHYKLVETKNYFLTELTEDKYVSIASDTYTYAVIDNDIICFREIKADGNTHIKIYGDIYEKEEKPMLFIDRYVVGGTFFLDNFTMCKYLSNEEEVSFYIPHDTVATYAVSIQ